MSEVDKKDKVVDQGKGETEGEEEETKRGSAGCKSSNLPFWSIPFNFFFG